MNLTRGQALVIAQALYCGFDSGQGHKDDEAELSIWRLIGLFYPDILEYHLHIPLVKKAKECPLNPSA